MSYRAPERLGPAHEFDAFVCASAEQSDWLAHHARQSTAAGTTRVFVVTPTDSRDVVAYDAWTMAQLDLAHAPARMRKGARRYPSPSHGSHGWVCTASTRARASVRHCSSTSSSVRLARALRVRAGAQRLPAPHPRVRTKPYDEWHLVLLLKDIKKTLLTQRP